MGGAGINVLIPVALAYHYFDATWPGFTRETGVKRLIS
jgi:hypothetical protein